MSLIDYMEWVDREAHLRRMAANAFSNAARDEFLKLADEIAKEESGTGAGDQQPSHKEQGPVRDE